MNQKPIRKCSWSEEELQFLRERGPNLSPKEIAAELNKNFETVKHMMRRLGIDWKRIKYAENRDADIRELWNSKTPTQIAELLKIPRKQVYKAADRLGLVITEPDRPLSLYRKAQVASSKVQREKSYARAHAKFGNWTSESAYVFGLLWADGYLVDCGVGLTVQQQDEKWHALIGHWFDPEIYISHDLKRCGNNGRSYPSVTWTWGCVEGRRMLERMGMPRRKSLIDPPYPPVPDDYFSHFARGFQDGDGSPTLTALRWYGSPRFMEGFREQALRVWHPVKPNQLLEHRSLRLMQWGAKADREQILPHLYRDAGVWYLPRKKKHAESESTESSSEDWREYLDFAGEWRLSVCESAIDDENDAASLAAGPNEE
jgi:Mn-dependent DtxR family transcriptional regulator